MREFLAIFEGIGHMRKLDHLLKFKHGLQKIAHEMGIAERQGDVPDAQLSELAACIYDVCEVLEVHCGEAQAEEDRRQAQAEAEDRARYPDAF